MKTQKVLSVMYSLLAVNFWAGAAQGQIVRVAPIVKQTPTPGGSERFAGALPPTSDALVADGSTFYIEVWATNSDVPQDGLACVHVDVSYSRTDVIDALPPAQNSPLFTINAVAPVFNDPGGFVDNVGGCQPAPAIDFLGVGEWVLVERLALNAVGTGGPVTVSLADANSVFAGTSIIGQLNNVDPADIEFQFRTFHVGTCLVDGDCDDGVPCTIDTCVSLVCNNAPDNALCDDGQFCNGAEVCDVFLNCQAGTPPNCAVLDNDGVACTDDVCDPAANAGAGGCVNIANNANCNDGQFCNGAETCNALLGCQAGTPPNCAVLDNDGVACTDDVCNPAANAGAGACVNNVNNANCSDGQFCNGAETCNALLGCQAGTPPNCAVLDNDGVACTDDVCNPSANAGAGGCVNNPNNANCNDGVGCTDDTCSALLGCQFAPNNANCNDGVACTVDACDPVLDCQFTPNDANCNDGQLCNGAEFCNSLLGCLAGIAPSCADSVACTVDTCNPALNGGAGACVHTPNNGACNDGFFCNGTETCNATLGCQAGTAPNCADSFACTADSCNETTDSCDHTPNNGLCSDGLFCNGTETCSATLGCQAGTAPNCADSFPCTADSCNETTDSCDHTPNNPLCDDGLYCNGVETCNALSGCQAGANPCTNPLLPGCDEVNNVCVVCSCPSGTSCLSALCNDNVGCTSDFCIRQFSVWGCSNVKSDAFCSDGSACTGIETCVPPGFKPANPITGCQAGTPFCPTVAQPDLLECIDTVTGPVCVECIADLDCDDGNLCTTEFCDPQNTCQVGPDPCDDGVGCTVDSCLQSTGSCLHSPSNPLCNDGLWCNGTETCNATLGCVTTGYRCPGQACDEPNDRCVQCVVNGDCADGIFCNGVETCVNFVCTAGSFPCNDSIACTTDSCNEVNDTCTHNPVNAACGDGQFCNGSEVCNITTGCEPGTPPNCAVLNNDGVACTDDVCNPAANGGTGGCVNTANNVNCSDGLFCTGIEICNAVLGCQAGAPVNCNDAIPCTTDSCNETTDSCNHNPANAMCSDGQFCNGAEVCDLSLGCRAATTPPCDDGVGCTIDQCNESLDICTNTPNDADCDDGVGCTVDICNPVTGCQSVPDDVFCDDDLFCTGIETCDPQDPAADARGCVPGINPCDDGDPCSKDLCDEFSQTCDNKQRGVYGDVDGNGHIVLFDLFCVLDGFQGDFTACSFEDDDLHPCNGNGVINLFDLFAVLDAFALMIDPCCHNGIGACCSASDPCFPVDSVIECTSAGGTFKGFGTDCFTDSDSDGILDIHESGSGVLDLPCDAGTDPNDPDTDGDGVRDGLEVYATADGLDLPAMGANPFRTDVFVEIDWTKLNNVELKPTAAAVNAIVQAFANAPVVSFDGSLGISLHIDYGQGGAFTGGKLIPGNWLYVNFDGGFNGFKSSNLAAARKGIFYYGIFAHRYNSQTNNSSGVAELGGDDFMVTLQDKFATQPANLNVLIGGSLMRMLGHNLGLRAGGNEDRDYKPNYNSIVNSRFQFSGIDVNCDAIGDGVFDYSDGSLLDLDEWALNEFAGVCGSVPIDWNGFGFSAGVARNINCVAGSTGPCASTVQGCIDKTCNVLVDHDDWAAIRLDTRSAGDPVTEVIFGPNTPP